MPKPPIVPASFVARPNRFIVTARLDDGTDVPAHLPNTGRLEDLMRKDNRLLLRQDGLPPRKTEYTVIRAWDGSWVGLEASRAPQLLREWLEKGNPFPGLGLAATMRSEVAFGVHRLDLLVEFESGPVWVEVKSGSRAVDGSALLSKTPSTRGASHLSSLGHLVARGERAAAAFVIQRGDVDGLLVGGDADAAWIQAVRSAHEAGVVVAAFGCDPTTTEVSIDRVMPVVWG